MSIPLDMKEAKIDSDLDTQAMSKNGEDLDGSKSTRVPARDDPEQIEMKPVHRRSQDFDSSMTAIATSNYDLVVQRTTTREDGTEYPERMKVILITIALLLAVFLISLDNSIISTAIPHITDQFHSLGDVGWYASAYFLTVASLQLLYGKFYTFFSIKWVFISAIFLFEVGSLVCGVAQSSSMLIGGRALAGCGAAGVLSGAMIILAHSVPLHRRPIFSGMLGGMYGIASVAGPLLGGAFTDKATWRWCFYINLPIGCVTVLVIPLFFPEPKRERSKDPWRKRIMQFDPFGTVVFMPAIICLLLALQWGGTTYAWNSGRIIALFVVFAVLIIVFAFVQFKQQDLATVPPRVIRRRTVWSSAFFSFCTGAAFFVAIYYLPIWFQAVKGASAVHSGIMNLPTLIASVIASIIAGTFVTTLGYYTPFMMAGAILNAIGFGLTTTFQPNSPSAKWIGYQILAGLGVGLGLQQPMIAVQTVLDLSDVPTGTAIIVFTQTLGGALFDSVAENVFTNKLVANIRHDVPGLDPKIVLATGATSIQSSIPPAELTGVTKAYNDALDQAFLVSAIMAAISFLASLAVEWRSVRAKKVDNVMA